MKNFIPYRVCCGKQHTGVVCPDNLIMCCLCFDRFPKSELAVIDGETWDICKPCNKRDKGKRESD